MSIIDTLVTDRSQADLQNLKKLLAIPYDQWTMEETEMFNLAASKGAYNASDLNRVNEACVYLAEKFKEYGYQVDVRLPTITDNTEARDYWELGDIPQESHMRLYLQNVNNLRSVFKAAAETPGIPGTMNGLSIEDANNIEKNLEIVNALLIRAATAWVYSGEAYSGEV